MTFFEWMNMSFGLSNAPSNFTRIMNGVFKYFIGRFVVIYLNDILVYNKDKEEHLIHLQEVFQVLRSQKCYANLKKCELFISNIVFLGFVVSSKGGKMVPIKMEAILSWPHPQTLHDIQSFHGLASFYHCLNILVLVLHQSLNA
jgi:hypothetical protein